MSVLEIYVFFGLPVLVAAIAAFVYFLAARPERGADGHHPAPPAE